MRKAVPWGSLLIGVSLVLAACATAPDYEQPGRVQNRAAEQAVSRAPEPLSDSNFDVYTASPEHPAVYVSAPSAPVQQTPTQPPSRRQSMDLQLQSPMVVPLPAQRMPAPRPMPQAEPVVRSAPTRVNTPSRLPLMGSSINSAADNDDSRLFVHNDRSAFAAPPSVTRAQPPISQPVTQAPMSRPPTTQQRYAAPTAGTDRDSLLSLGPGDVVTMTIVGYPELRSVLYVANDGSISVPMAGVVQVGGMEPAAAAQRVAQAYSAGEYLVDPQVNLVVSESHSQQISVLGEVRSPGRFPVQTRLGVFDALALGGGVSELGADDVYVLRREGGRMARYDVDLHGALQGAQGSSYLELQPGDTVIVPRAEQFYIYGEVRAPNAYRLRPGMTVMQALALGGGLTERGSDRRVEIKRKQPDGDVHSLGAELGDRLQPDDVIYVKERFF